MDRIRTSWLQILVHVAALSPLMILAWDFSQGGLGANPIRELQLRTGRLALLLLVLTLVCSPVSILPRLRRVAMLRRTLGLYAFGYASLHLINFIGLDYGFDFEWIRQDMLEKRYALAGLAAYLCLVPLALTSTKAWMRRLGKNWRHLHRLVFLSGALAVLHFLWGVKANAREPLLYGIVLVALLLLRSIPIVMKVVGRLRGRMPVK